MSATAAKYSVLKLTVDSTPTALGEVRSYSIETALGTIDASVLSTTWKNYLLGSPAGRAPWNCSTTRRTQPRRTW